MNENLKYIEAGLRAAEGIRMTHRRIWMILQIAAQISANGEVGIKEMLQLKDEADRLFDADGNLKQDEESEAVGPPEQRKTGFDFGATRKRPDIGDLYFTPLYDVCPPDEIQTPTSIVWDNLSCEQEWLENGKIFTDRRKCKGYCDYLNSLQP